MEKRTIDPILGLVCVSLQLFCFFLSHTYISTNQMNWIVMVKQIKLLLLPKIQELEYLKPW